MKRFALKVTREVEGVFRPGAAVSGILVVCAVAAIIVAGEATARVGGSVTSLNRFADFGNGKFAGTFINRWRVPSAERWTGLSDSGEPWPSGGGIWEVATPYGPGFRFVTTDEMTTYPGAKSAQVVDIDHLVDQDSYLGTVTTASGKFLLPRAGNPDGFPPFRDFNALWEFGPGIASNNQFGIDAAAHRLYVRSYAAGLPNNRRKALAPGRIRFDHWYDWRWQIKWSTGPDGFVNFWLDRRQIVSWLGPTIPEGLEPPWIQFGFYGGTQKHRNEVWWARLRITS